MKHTQVLHENIRNSQRILSVLIDSEELAQSFEQSVKKIVASFKNSGRLFIAGNGGSAADAQHLAAEFISKLARPRDPLPAEALSTDTSILTAIGNDYGFEFIFERQLRSKFRKGDVFLGITTSGESPNILRALEYLKSIGGSTILLTGKNGGKAIHIADTTLLVPHQITATIQESHLVIYHSLCQAVEDEMFPV